MDAPPVVFLKAWKEDDEERGVSVEDHALALIRRHRAASSGPATARSPVSTILSRRMGARSRQRWGASLTSTVASSAARSEDRSLSLQKGQRAARADCEPRGSRLIRDNEVDADSVERWNGSLPNKLADLCEKLAAEDCGPGTVETHQP